VSNQIPFTTYKITATTLPCTVAAMDCLQSMKLIARVMRQDTIGLAIVLGRVHHKKESEKL